MTDTVDDDVQRNDDRRIPLLTRRVRKGKEERREKSAPAKREISLEYHMQYEYPGLMQIFDFSTHLASTPYLDQTSVRVPEAIYRSAIVGKTRLLSEEFLLNYKRSTIDLGLVHGVTAYLGFPARAAMALMETKEEKLANVYETIELPPHRQLKMSLDAAIRSRRSRREMSGDEMSLRDLSTLLFYGDGAGDGAQRLVDIGEDQVWPSASLGEPPLLPSRNAPSGGGAYPVEMHLLLQNVNGVDDGLYQFLPLTHSLVKRQEMNEADWAAHRENAHSWGLNIDPDKVNVAVFYVYSLFQNSRKYAELGLNFAMIEVGAISHNVHLAATAMGLASSCIGGGDKVPREQLLGIDGLSKHYVHTTVIGRPSTVNPD